MKIQFRVNDAALGIWRDVEGYVVNPAPHLSATFAVHRCPWRPNRWRVSDVETGSRATEHSYASRAMAIFKAEIALRDKTEEMLQKAWKDKPDWVKSGHGERVAELFAEGKGAD
jgi:hypothetical protein